MSKLKTLQIGDKLPEREHYATNVSLFLYNAAIWNPHRIHYDERYTTEVEQHPGVIIDGPLQGDWLTQVVINWLGDDGQLVEFEYSNRRASMLGETLTAGGTVTTIDGNSVTLDIFIRNEAGDITSPGSAIVQMNS
jgi:hydroxyacyl-ACP dehydratase HTD2-like protein with hotdog domain